MKECFVCGAGVEVIKDQPYEYKDGGIEVIIIGLAQFHCATCNETYTPIPKPKMLHKAIGQSICSENKSLLTGDEIRFLRKAMELKGNELAQIMGVDVSTLSRWENNRKEVGDSNDRLLRSIFLQKFPCPTSDASVAETLKEIPAKRKQIKKKHSLFLNPAEWLMDCGCLAC